MQFEVWGGGEREKEEEEQTYHNIQRTLIDYYFAFPSGLHIARHEAKFSVSVAGVKDGKTSPSHSTPHFSEFSCRAASSRNYRVVLISQHDMC